MKKLRRTAGILCVMLMIFGLMTGCGTDYEQEAQEEAAGLEQEVEETAETAEQSAEQSSDPADGEAAEIGEDAALAIALKDAGLSESDVDRINCKLDYDDGRTEYEIEFHKGKTEYEYTVDAFSGEILEKDIDDDDD